MSESGVDLSAGVAARVSALCLEPNGRLPDRLISSDAVRAALLADLALAGRMTPTEDSVVVDGTPTGYPPADRLLAAIAAEPERSLDAWLRDRRIGLRDVAAANVAAGRWRRRTGPLGLLVRYTDCSPEQTGRDLSRSFEAWPGDGGPEDACVTVIGAAGALIDREFGLPERPAADVVAATGRAEWLCGTVVEHLIQAAARYREQAQTLEAGIFAPF